MPDSVALLGLVLFWASLFWLPLNIYRAVKIQTGARMWAIAGCLSFGMVLMGYTRAMASGNLNEALAWSVAWIMPLGLSIYVRNLPGCVAKTADKYVVAAAIVSFLPLGRKIPEILQVISQTLW